MRILRWHELATGKRWSFRDIFTLVSHLFAGIPQDALNKGFSPCKWAAELSIIAQSGNFTPLVLTAPYILASAQYQHALFGIWPILRSRLIREDIKSLDLLKDPGLMGFYYFISATRDIAGPSTLKPQLAELSAALDPALAPPETTITFANRTLKLGPDIDANFSQSVEAGYEMAKEYLSQIECNLLKVIATSDNTLGSTEFNRKNPAAVRRLQACLRDFACRFVRRSLGTRFAVTRDHDALEEYERIACDVPDLGALHSVAKQVESLLNSNDRFLTDLTTTFGEPVAPVYRRARLATAKQKVKNFEMSSEGRPSSPIRFLKVGSTEKAHPVPITYELFRSVRELKSGMLPASLPRAVIAMLDTTRARIAGRLVRDEDLLDEFEISIADTSEIVSRELGKFVTRKEHAK